MTAQIPQVLQGPSVVIGETIEKTVVVQPGDLLHSQHASYALTSEQLEILLMNDGPANSVLEIGIGATASAVLTLLVAFLKWLPGESGITLWTAVEDYVWFVLLGCALMAGAVVTKRSGETARQKLVSKLRKYFDDHS